MKCSGKQAYNLRLGQRTLPRQEVLEEFPVGDVARAKQLRIVNRPIDDLGALSVGQGSVGNRVRKETKTRLLSSFYHFYLKII